MARLVEKVSHHDANYAIQSRPFAQHSTSSREQSLQLPENLFSLVHVSRIHFSRPFPQLLPANLR